MQGKTNFAENPRSHPKVKAGYTVEEKLLTMFLSSFVFSYPLKFNRDEEIF